MCAIGHEYWKTMGESIRPSIRFRLGYIATWLSFLRDAAGLSCDCGSGNNLQPIQSQAVKNRRPIVLEHVPRKFPRQV